MLAQSHARKPAPPLAARGMWLRLGVGADAFGNALGDSVVGAIQRGDANKVPPPVSAQERAQILDLFKDGPGGDAALDEWRAHLSSLGISPKTSDPLAELSIGEDLTDAQKSMLLLGKGPLLANVASDGLSRELAKVDLRNHFLDGSGPLSDLAREQLVNGTEATNAPTPDTSRTIRKISGGLQVTEGDGSSYPIQDKKSSGWNADSPGLSMTCPLQPYQSFVERSRGWQVN